MIEFSIGKYYKGYGLGLRKYSNHLEFWFPLKLHFHIKI